MTTKTTTKTPTIDASDRAALQRLAQRIRVRQRNLKQDGTGRWEIRGGNTQVGGAIWSGGAHGGYLIRLDRWTPGGGGRFALQSRWADRLGLFTRITSSDGTSWCLLDHEPNEEQSEIIRGALQLPRVPDWEAAEAA